MTIAGVADLPDDSWVTACEGVVLKVEQKPTKKGGTWWPCVIGNRPGDYTKSVSVGFFAAPAFAEGDRIRISGQGTRKGSYNNKPQLNLGKAAKVEVVSVGTQRIQAAMNRPATPDPAVTGPSVIHGATVGAALNQVFSALTRGLTPVEVREDLKSPEFWSALEQGASDFIRLSRKLEAGKLAERPEDSIPY